MIDWIYINILPTLSRAAIEILNSSLKLRIIGENHLNNLNSCGERIIFALWHGRQFLIIPYFSHQNLCVISSTSRDGILQANILKKLGYTIVPGSSSKSPVRALMGSIKKIKQGHNTAIAVDGPTGPIYKVKPGALFLAKKTGSAIVPLTFSSRSALILNAWDKYLLPKPFSHSLLIIDEPFYPTRDTGQKQIQKECLYIENRLNYITNKADKLLRKL